MSIAQEPAASEAEIELTPRQKEMFEKASKIQPVDGPAEVDIGTRAKIKVPEGYQFLNAGDAQALLEARGNLPDPSILGLILPTEKSKWFIIFRFDDIGYIKDADKESINADELISSFRAGIEPENEQRRAQGVAELRQIDWSDKPFYDPQTNNLTWGIHAKFDDGDSINYEIRILGRAGVMSTTMVSAPEGYQEAVGPTKALLSGFEFKDGSKYADWKPGDKIAEYGLVGLIGAGGLAVAAKTGLLAKLGLILAKLGKGLIVVVFAIGAGIVSLFKKIFGSRGHHDSAQQQL